MNARTKVLRELVRDAHYVIDEPSEVNSQLRQCIGILVSVDRCPLPGGWS